MTRSPDSDYQREILQFLYEENERVASTFWEWRHKVMTFFVTVAAVLLAIAGWVIDHDLDELMAAAPILLAAFFSLVAAGLNLRTGRIVSASYEAGAALEARLNALRDPEGQAPLGKQLIFEWLQASRREDRPFLERWTTYQRLLTAAFFSLAVALAVFAVLVLAGYVTASPTCEPTRGTASAPVCPDEDR